MFTEKLMDRLKHAYSITVMTAGDISAESTLFTFEDVNERWNNQKITDILNKKNLKGNPKQYWDFIRWYRKKINETEPNLGHYTLVDFEKKFKGFALITQNFDNMHRKAGNNRILELKGNFMLTRCLNCGELFDQSFDISAAVPSCTKCSGVVRPNIIMPDEELNQKLMEKAKELSEGCEVFFAIGTSRITEPIGAIPYLAKGNGAYIVEINPHKTSLTSSTDEYLFGSIEKILPQLIMTYERIM